jgi:hypothetical protein
MRGSPEPSPSGCAGEGMAVDIALEGQQALDEAAYDVIVLD